MAPLNQEQIINLIKSGQNPQQLAIRLIQDRIGSTPLGSNLLNLAQNNKGKEIETIVRNYVNQNGGNFDRDFNAFKQMLGIR